MPDDVVYINPGATASPSTQVAAYMYTDSKPPAQPVAPTSVASVSAATSSSQMPSSAVGTTSSDISSHSVSPTSSSTPVPSGGLSTGAKIGIGVGVAGAVCLFAAFRHLLVPSCAAQQEEDRHAAAAAAAPVHTEPTHGTIHSRLAAKWLGAIPSERHAILCRAGTNVAERRAVTEHIACIFAASFATSTLGAFDGARHADAGKQPCPQRPSESAIGSDDARTGGTRPVRVSPRYWTTQVSDALACRFHEGPF